MFRPLEGPSLLPLIGIEEIGIEHLIDAHIEECITSYQGTRKQLTPAYSAVKYNGIPAYQLARQGKKVPRKEKTIRIDSIQIESFQLPLVSIRVKCSKGTYIRTLVDDIGQDLKVGAHLIEIERTAVGPYFSLKNAYNLDAISECHQRNDPSCWINPVDLLKELKTLQVTEEEQQRLKQGRSVALSESVHPINSAQDLGGLTKAIDAQQTLIAIGHVIANKNWYQFNPSKIFV